ncbi:hypothetical protein [Streptomyces otsuchiensis]|uniref:hypothetical protein n=1 Tax=Streptomyces otsuchiensis TaxID=2681388 RepID=UPI00102FE1F8|nr:hypothetical protein [Streptomyces otsuchiensis]
MRLRDKLRAGKVITQADLREEKETEIRLLRASLLRTTPGSKDEAMVQGHLDDAVDEYNKQFVGRA